MTDIIFDGGYEKTPITQKFAATLTNMMDNDSDVVYLDADLMFAWGGLLTPLLEKYPERMLRCGIAEANMIGVAAAMSVMGIKPIVHSFASFITRRAFDQIFLSGAYAGKTINMIGSEPGYKQTYWGGTHMAFEDIAIMRTVPGAYVFDIVDANQFDALIQQTVNMKGIYYYRTPLADNIGIYKDGEKFEIGKGKVLKDGSDATIIAAGRLVSLSLQAAQLLEKEGVSVRVIDMFTIMPLDTELVLKAAKETGAIVTAENHSVHGGLGAAVCEYLSQVHPTPVTITGVNQEFGEVGSEEYLRGRFGFNPQDIAENVRKTIAKK